MFKQLDWRLQITKNSKNSTFKYLVSGSELRALLKNSILATNFRRYNK